jgi:hypothetical protein
MKKHGIIALLGIGMVLNGCDDENPVGGLPGGNSSQNGEWLIPVSEVRDGGPGKDGIPALSNPKFISLDKVDYFLDNELVIGFVDGDKNRAYPHSILDWHEIVNDRVGSVDISVTYCPLTGTWICWDRKIIGKVTTFGVSGLLYNSNLIPYDRETDSNWSQIGLQCVNGPLVGTEAVTIGVVETKWGTWKKIYPESKVLSTNTGYNRGYGFYPYGDYRADHAYLLFPVSGGINCGSGK